MNARGAVYAGTAAIFYGSSYVATAIALRGFTPLTLAAWRGLLGAALVIGFLLLPLFAADRPPRPTAGALVRLVVLGLVGGAIFIVAMNVAVALAGASVTAFVAGLYAVSAALLAIPILGERLERSTLMALLVALIGTALLAEIQAGPDTLAGVGVGLVAAFFFGLFLVLSRRWGVSHGLRGPIVGIATLSISGAVGLAAALLAGQPVLPPDLHLDQVASMLWIAAAPGAAGQVLIVAGMNRLEARHASVLLLLNPPTAAVLSLLLLGEGLRPLQLLGGACVLVAIAVAGGITRRSRPLPYAP